MSVLICDRNGVDGFEQKSNLCKGSSLNPWQGKVQGCCARGARLSSRDK